MTDNIKELEEQVAAAEGIVSSWAARKKMTVDKYNEVQAPFQAKIRALEKEREAAVAPIFKESNEFDANLRLAEEALKAAKLRLDGAKFAKLGVTDVKLFEAWCKAGLGNALATRFDIGWGNNAKEAFTIKSPAVGLKDMSGGSRTLVHVYMAEHYDDKHYVAFNEDGTKVLGWLKVTPSKHPGDWTAARGLVKGKAFLQDHYGDKAAKSESVSDAVKPVGAFKDALKAAVGVA